MFRRLTAVAFSFALLPLAAAWMPTDEKVTLVVPGMQ